MFFDGIIKGLFIFFMIFTKVQMYSFSDPTPTVRAFFEIVKNNDFVAKYHYYVVAEI